MDRYVIPKIFNKKDWPEKVKKVSIKISTRN